jgi:hypothetical protein
MNEAAAGLLMRHLAKEIKEERGRVTNLLFTLLVQSLELLERTKEFIAPEFKAPYSPYQFEGSRDQLKKAAQAAQQLLPLKSNLKLNEACAALKDLQDAFEMYSWELYPHHDEELYTSERAKRCIASYESQPWIPAKQQPIEDDERLPGTPINR